MKNNIKTLIITVILFTIPVYAIGISGGVKGSVCSANLSNENPVVDGQSKIGFCGGVFASFDVLNFIAIQPEVLYTQKGMKYSVDARDEFGQYIGSGVDKTCLDYLEVPVLLKVKIPLQSIVQPNLFIGPYFAFNLSAKDRLEINGDVIENDLEGYKNNDYGLVLGAGMDFGLSFGKIVSEIRYSLGLTSINEASNEVKNKVISVMLGYGITN